MCYINLRFTLHHIAVTRSNKLATESEGMSLRSVTDEVDGLAELLLDRQRCSFFVATSPPGPICQSAIQRSIQ